MKKTGIFILFLLAVVGMTDSAYLTYEHFSNFIPPCSTSFFVDCGKVLRSEYAVLLGVPIALLGLIHYIVLFTLLIWSYKKHSRTLIRLLFLQTAFAFLFSLYLVILQLFIIQSICLYCMVSALVSFTVYFLVRRFYFDEYKVLFISKQAFFYKRFLKPVFFLIDPEFIHVLMVRFGELLGSIPFIRSQMGRYYKITHPALTQKISGIVFKNPIGLAAGFDYEARLTQILPSIGFGFETVGTVTNLPYGGNKKPMLGRLPKSRSLMVNKGFKSAGAEVIIRRLKGKHFSIPIGVSIGRTNTTEHKKQAEAVDDIIQAFRKFENSPVRNAYYELNISCPNLRGDITFYTSENLKALLSEVQKLHLKKPLFIKMPIEKSNEEIMNMLEIIAKFSVTGVIFGNLQKNRKDPALNPDEVRKWKVGNFSGKPTQKRSDELIGLAFKHFHKKLIIIGCGGVFNAEDAYRKIRLGATLVQMITGMIYEGPQVINQINSGLLTLLKKDGFHHLSEAIGVDSHKNKK